MFCRTVVSERLYKTNFFLRVIVKRIEKPLPERGQAVPFPGGWLLQVGQEGRCEDTEGTATPRVPPLGPPWARPLVAEGQVKRALNVDESNPEAAPG